jgi:elongation factor Ts
MSDNISAALVKELRERTGAGIMECKRALVDAQGDIEKAIEIMRKSGQAKANKKAGRTAAEGVALILVSEDQKEGIALEINCETDFVARDTHFVEFAELTAKTALSSKAQDLDTLLSTKLGNGETIDETRHALVAKIGENIQVRRYIRKKSSHKLIGYVHGSRIAALVELEGGNDALGKDIAMHIIASNPMVINPSEVPAELLDKEKEIYTAEAQSSGKPANIIQKMTEGRINKFLAEVSLVGQPFVKDPDKTVGALLKEAHANVHGFIRIAVGEGIEKKVEDFAEAVMKQVEGS